jgi:CHAT domain-containing protein
MDLFGSKKLDTRYLELRGLVARAEAGEGYLRPQVRDEAWALLKVCVKRMAFSTRSAVIAYETSMISAVEETAAGNWLRVVATGWMTTGAIAAVDAHSGAESNPAILEAIAKGLFRRAEVFTLAAHRAGVPAVAGIFAEQLTSLQLSERALWRSLTALAARSRSDQLRVAGDVGGGLAGMSSEILRGGLSFDGKPEELNAWFEQQVRKDFHRIDRKRRGARVAMSLGVEVPLEAMRTTGRSLLYLGGSVHDGVAVLFDASALDDPSAPLATSITLPTADVVWVEREVAGLRRAADDRRAHRTSGTELTSHVEGVLQRLGELVWQPILQRWPHLRATPLAVIPLGELSQLPLYTAMVDGRPACSVLDLTMTPSARALVLAGEDEPSPGPVFVAADPSSGDDELHYVVAEAEAVAAVHGVPALIVTESAGEAPPEEKLRTTLGTPVERPSGDLLHRLRNSAVVHLACHGVINHRTPLTSTLVLAGALTLDTVLAEDLRHGCVVVLSACDLAGTGSETPGEQLGFPAVLLAGGARSVVAALWPVPDSPRTVRLMRRFHEGLASAPPNRALGAAIGHAFDAGVSASLWAPFACFGA